MLTIDNLNDIHTILEFASSQAEILQANKETDKIDELAKLVMNEIKNANSDRDPYNVLSSVYHQLATDADLDSVSRPDKYADLAALIRDVLSEHPDYAAQYSKDGR